MSGHRQPCLPVASVLEPGSRHLCCYHIRSHKCPPACPPAALAMQDYLHSLFMHVDRNHDGRMDMEEFRAAMRALGDELDGRTVRGLR